MPQANPRTSTPKRHPASVRKLAAKPSVKDSDQTLLALIDTHRAALENLSRALDIPETPEHQKRRDRAEDAAHRALRKAEAPLVKAVPGSIDGAIAALGYFLSRESTMALGIEGKQAAFLTNLFLGLLRIQIREPAALEAAAAPLPAERGRHRRGG